MKKILVIISLIIISCKTEKKETQNNIPKIKKEHTLEKNIKVKESEPFFINGIRIDTLLNFKDQSIQIRKTNLKLDYEKSLFEKQIDSITRTEDNAHRRSLLREEILIKKFDSIVKKDSTGLYLKLSNGWKLIELNPNTEEIENTFENYFVEEDLFLVRTQWGEGNDYKLISKRNGKTFSTFGEPYFSKNNNFLLSVNVDLVAEYTESGFEFFKFENSELSYFGSFKTKNWGPLWAKGITENIFLVKCIFMDENFNEKDFYIEIEFMEN